MNNNESLQKVMMSIGLFLVGISLYCSFLLYTSFSSNLSDKAAWGGMGLGLDMFKNVSLIAAIALWALNVFAARILSVVVFIAYAILSTLSFMAFFGFMSNIQHDLEQDSILASSKYQSAQSAVEQAEQRVAELSRYADSLTVQEAEAKLAEIKPRLINIQQQMATYAEADCTPKRDRRGAPYTTLATEWCAKLRAVEAEAAQWQRQVDNHHEYRAALAHREKMLEQISQLDSGSVEVGASHLHPMFVDLGKLVSATPDEMKVIFMFVSSASAEILGTLSVLISYLLGHKRSFTLDEIEVLSGQLREQQGRLQHALGVTGIPAALGLPSGSSGGMAFAVADASSPSSGTEKKLSKPEDDTMQRGNIASVSPRKHQRTAKSQTGKSYQPRDPIRVTPVPVKETVYSRARLTEMTEAIFAGKCPPDVSELSRRYGVPEPVALTCLDTLAHEDYLLRDPLSGQYTLNLKRIQDHSSSYAGKLMCGGVEYRDAGKPVKIYFPNPSASLPVRRRSGELAWVAWGRRKNEHRSRMPPGSCAPLNTIHNGEWSQYNPRSVLIPASSYMEQDNQGRKHWFPLELNMLIQGLLAQRGAEQRLYIVTVETPPEFSPGDSLPRPECWPRLIRQGEEGSRPVFY